MKKESNMQSGIQIKNNSIAIDKKGESVGNAKIKVIKIDPSSISCFNPLSMVSEPITTEKEMTEENYILLLSVIRFDKNKVINNTFRLWCNLIQDRKTVYDEKWELLIELGFVIYSEREDKDLINYTLTEKAVDYISNTEGIVIEKNHFFE